jgi:hypothetical protein
MGWVWVPAANDRTEERMRSIDNGKRSWEQKKDEGGMMK